MIRIILFVLTFLALFGFTALAIWKGYVYAQDKNDNSEIGRAHV